MKQDGPTNSPACRTNPLYTTLSLAEPETAENWAQAIGWTWNDLVKAVTAADVKY